MRKHFQQNCMQKLQFFRLKIYVNNIIVSACAKRASRVFHVKKSFVKLFSETLFLGRLTVRVDKTELFKIRMRSKFIKSTTDCSVSYAYNILAANILSYENGDSPIASRSLFKWVSIRTNTLFCQQGPNMYRHYSSHFWSKFFHCLLRRIGVPKPFRKVWTVSYWPGLHSSWTPLSLISIRGKQLIPSWKLNLSPSRIDPLKDSWRAIFSKNNKGAKLHILNFAKHPIP